MTVDHLIAIDEIYARFNDSITDYMSTELDYVPKIYWDDEEIPETINPAQLYYHVRNYAIKQGQDTIATDANERQFLTIGLLIVSIYTPRIMSDGQRVTRDIANYIRSLYINSTVSGVWFRDQEIKDRVTRYNPNFYHVTVQVTYEHNEVFANA